MAMLRLRYKVVHAELKDTSCAYAQRLCTFVDSALQLLGLESHGAWSELIMTAVWHDLHQGSGKVVALTWVIITKRFGHVHHICTSPAIYSLIWIAHHKHIGLQRRPLADRTRKLSIAAVSYMHQQN